MTRQFLAVAVDVGTTGARAAALAWMAGWSLRSGSASAPGCRGLGAEQDATGWADGVAL
jgi:hypothetical protein